MSGDIELGTRMSHPTLLYHEVQVDSYNEKDNEIVVWIKDLTSSRGYGWRENWDLEDTYGLLRDGIISILYEQEDNRDYEMT